MYHYTLLGLHRHPKHADRDGFMPERGDAFKAMNYAGKMNAEELELYSSDNDAWSEFVAEAVQWTEEINAEIEKWNNR